MPDIQSLSAAEVMQYIETHSDEVETEYQAVLQQAEENRRYWEARNKEHLARTTVLPSKLGQEELRAKLQASKMRSHHRRSSEQ